MSARSSQFVLLAWAIALLGTAGSLFFSEVMKHAPCVLCWYQRIALYPLVLILGIGWHRGDRAALRYAIPLAALGLAIALYHVLLYYGVIPESISPCTGGTSCKERQIEWLGFISIPLLSLGAFGTILALLFGARTGETQTR